MRVQVKRRMGRYNERGMIQGGRRDKRHKLLIEMEGRRIDACEGAGAVKRRREVSHVQRFSICQVLWHHCG